MRTKAQDTAPQIALTNCSKEGEGQYLCDFGGERVHAIEHVSFQNISASFMKPFPHSEAFYYFSTYKEM